MNLKIADYIITGILLLVFSYTFVNKILIFDSFLLNIAKTDLFALSMVPLIAYSALALEATVIISMLYKTEYGYFAAFFTLAVFIIYILVLFSLDKYETCGCGGILNGLDFYSHLFIDVMLLFLAYSGTLIHKKR